MSKRNINNKEKSKVEYFKLVPMLSDKEGKTKNGEAYLIRGSLDDHVIVSVPTTISHRASIELEMALEKKIMRPIIIVTHNVEFMKVRKLSERQATAISTQMEREAVNAKRTAQNTEGKDEMGREPEKVFTFKKKGK